MQQEIIDNKEKDFSYSWVSSSRFLFYCQVALLVSVILSACVALYTHRYKGKPKVEVPENTLYNPKYK
ncbi:hypothetical protein ACFOWM_13330 [Ferruginibacter yonginensis]|uniref:Uncharacterized protein n=1 Tax=Ferruginibacter yonginensis TaxID=1310416 RepID=A0ABV8QUE3_9BACT